MSFRDDYAAALRDEQRAKDSVNEPTTTRLHHYAGRYSFTA